MKKNQKSKPIFSIIIPTRNRAKDLERCLQSIKNQVYKNYEIIIVDDESADNTKQIAVQYKTRYIYHKIRTGQNIGKNNGAALAHGKILIFTDDDCICDKYWLKNILAGFKQSDTIGAVGGKIVNLGPGNVINIHTFPLWTLLNFFKKQTGRILFFGIITTNFDADKKNFVDWISAGNMAIRRDVFEKIGGFAADYAGHCAFEEPDICARIKNLQYKILFQPGAVCIHKHSDAARKSENIVRLSHKSNEIFFHLRYLHLLHSVNKLWAFFLFLSYHSWDFILVMVGIIYSTSCWYDAKGKVDGIWRYYMSNINR